MATKEGSNSRSSVSRKRKWRVIGQVQGGSISYHFGQLAGSGLDSYYCPVTVSYVLDYL